ncbi:hypothetical protein SAY86_018794 [Trapa natans]|uniref:SelT-like protein n=1 Tax=Trapa natans TaxID=22666 RepID=A0AAN7R229_TRANT|nr:hypothetical protein SAY86_018794 [Trapa natans]
MGRILFTGLSAVNVSMALAVIYAVSPILIPPSSRLHLLYSDLIESVSCSAVSAICIISNRICNWQYFFSAEKMYRGQILLLGLPLFLIFTDLVNLFSPPPPKPHPPHHHHHPHVQHPPHHHHPPPEVTEFPSQKPSVLGGIGLGSVVNINFCSSCSYKGTAVTMMKMIETQFPGIHVVLANYPPALPKRVLAKLVPVAQMGVFAMMMAGDRIFPMIGFAVPPPWYYSLRGNRFGTIASTWLLGNVFQSFLQSSGAFEVYCNDVLVFSKLKEGRFPGEIELKDLIGRQLGSSILRDSFGGIQS